MVKYIEFNELKKGTWYACEYCQRKEKLGPCYFKFKEVDDDNEPSFIMSESIIVPPLGERTNAPTCTFYDGCVRTVDKKDKKVIMAGTI